MSRSPSCQKRQQTGGLTGWFGGPSGNLKSVKKGPKPFHRLRRSLRMSRRAHKKPLLTGGVADRRSDGVVWSSAIRCACAHSPLWDSGNTARMRICRVEAGKNLKSGRKADAKRQLPANGLRPVSPNIKAAKVLPHSKFPSLGGVADRRADGVVWWTF